jgi:hypothetical protein
MKKPIYPQQPCKCLCFSAEDTLRIAQFVSYLQQTYRTIVNRCIVYVERLHTRNRDGSIRILAVPLGAEINGYLRRIMVGSVPDGSYMTWEETTRPMRMIPDRAEVNNVLREFVQEGGGYVT